MKKTVSIVILLFMVIAMAASPAALASGGAVVTVKAEAEQATKSVSITGTISTGAGKQVSVVVLNPSGNVDYIDQTTSGADGAYAFRYKLDETADGTYSVSVGGSGVAAQAAATFAYSAGTGDPSDPSDPSDASNPSDPSDASNPSNPSNPAPPGQPGDHEGSKQTVSAEELKKDGGGHRVVLLAEGKNELLLPLDAGDIVGDGKLEIRGRSFSVAIDAAVLKALAELAEASGAQNAQISFMAEPVSGNEAEALIRQAERDHAKAAGELIRFELSVIAGDGKTYRLSAFDKPARVTLPFRADADKDLLGVYYYDETAGAWAFIGGKADESGTAITAEFPHFSTYAVLEYGKTFDDVPAGHWAFRAVNVLAAKHVVNGVSDMRFAPGKDVTRAEFAALLTRALGLKAVSAAPFADVDGFAWSAGDIAAAYEAGLIKGRTNGTFAPDDTITREEMAAMLVRAYGFAGGRDSAAGEGKMSFFDAGDVSEWAVHDVNAAVKNGLMNGTSGSRFAPAAHATRAETAEALLRLLQLLQRAG